MTRSELLEDIAYVRTLAEEGRAAPLLGGAYFVGWGLLVSAAWAGHYAIITNLPDTQWGQWLGGMWFGFGVVGGVMSLALQRRVRGKPGASSVGNRGERAVWMGIGFALTAIAIGAILRMAVFGEITAPNTILPAAMTLYGAGMIATAKLSGEKLLHPFGLVAVAFGFCMGVIANLPIMYLLGSIAALFVLVLPGALLLRREPSTVV